MSLKSITFAIIANLGIAAGAQAVTLDFGNVSQDVVFNTYTEDGFVVDGSNTSVGSVDNGLLAEGIFSAGEYFSISRVDGGDFTLTSFDYAAEDYGYVSDGFTVQGFLDGSLIADFGSFVTGSWNYITAFIGSTTLIDELRFVGNGDINSTSPVWDNIVLEPAGAAVPLPAGLPLMLMGLAGLGIVRRRRAVN